MPETVIAAPTLKNVAQKVNEWGNSWSGLVSAATLIVLGLTLVRRLK